MFILSLVRFWLKRVSRQSAYKIIVGRYIDRHEPQKGRFTYEDVDRILDQVWLNFSQILPQAHLEQYEKLGNRQNVMLTVLSLAVYRAFLAAGIETAYATELFSDFGWKVYETMIRVPRLIARMLFHNPQKQMDFILKVLLRYPFSYGNPGYQGEAWASLDGFHTHWYRCPAYEYVRDHGRDGEVEFFYKTWCQFDYAAAQVMVEDGRFERPHCLSLGDEVCDMRWYANNQAVNRQA